MYGKIFVAAAHEGHCYPRLAALAQCLQQGAEQTWLVGEQKKATRVAAFFLFYQFVVNLFFF